MTKELTYKEQTAKDDLLDWLRIARPNREALNQLKDSIRRGDIDPESYWNPASDCGCVKGVLFYFDYGETPYQAALQHVADFSNVSLCDVGAGSIIAHLDSQISLHFNEAPVDPVLAFESWLSHDYRRNHVIDQNMLISWIEEYQESET